MQKNFSCFLLHKLLSEAQEQTNKKKNLYRRRERKLTKWSHCYVIKCFYVVNGLLRIQGISNSRPPPPMAFTVTSPYPKQLVPSLRIGRRLCLHSLVVCRIFEHFLLFIMAQKHVLVKLNPRKSNTFLGNRIRFACFYILHYIMCKYIIIYKFRFTEKELCSL